MQNEAALAVVPAKRVSLVEKFATKYSVEPAKLLTTLKQTAFKAKEGEEVTNEQMMALMIVADQYGLNPFVKEIFAFPDKSGGIVPVVGVDGWSRIINEHPMFDGMDFHFPDQTDAIPAWIECVMHRKDRAHPIIVREYMAECKRGTGPWGSHPRRMLRHKAVIQAARVAFGYTGIYDEDEAERIIGAGLAEGTVEIEKPTQSATERVKAGLKERASQTFDNEPKAAAPQASGVQDGGGTIVTAPEEDSGNPAPAAAQATTAEPVNTQTAIAGLAGAESIEAITVYAESLPMSVRTNSKFQKAVTKRIAELTPKAAASKGTSAGWLRGRFEGAHDVDTLDADADLIDDVRDAKEQEALRLFYNERRAKLTGDES